MFIQLPKLGIKLFIYHTYKNLCKCDKFKLKLGIKFTEVNP